MALRNSETRYGAVAMTLHWLIAAMILGLVAVGFIMGDLENSDPNKFKLYQLHKSFGLTVLALSVLRLLWRLVNPLPPLPGDLKAWERLLARATHVVFYALMIGTPLVGWAMVSASPFNIPTRFFGQFEVPHLPYFATAPEKADLAESLAEVHEMLAFGILGLLALHVGAALKHHFILKDSVLVRMLPFTKVSP